MKFWASLFLLNDEKSHKRSKTKFLFALKSIMWTKNLNVRYSAPLPHTKQSLTQLMSSACQNVNKSSICIVVFSNFFKPAKFGGLQKVKAVPF